MNGYKLERRENNGKRYYVVTCGSAYIKFYDLSKAIAFMRRG